MKGLYLLLLVVYLLLFLDLDVHSIVVIHRLSLFLGVYKPNLATISPMFPPQRYLHPIQRINLIIVCSIL